MNFDVRRFSDSEREAMAWRVHEAGDFQLPKLDVWNYSPCRAHATGWVEQFWDADRNEDRHRTVYDRPKPGCRNCGLIFRQHQRVGIAWLYLKKRGLLADSMGPQPHSARILTPTGWTTMGEIQPGERVIAPEGGDSSVIAVYDQGVQPVYAVTFTDGSVVEASGTHLWEVNTPSRKCNGRSPLVLTTDDLVARGLQYQNGNSKWYVPMTSPVEFDEVPLTLDPYLVGALLGDGSLSGHTVGISTDKLLVDSLILPEGTKISARGADTADCHDDFTLLGSSLRDALRDLGMLGQVSETKSIPDAYLYGSSSTRISLLQGLLDTDGTTMHGRNGALNSTLEYGTVSGELAEQVSFLVQSLGGTVYTKTKKPVYIYKGEKKEGQLFFRINISLPSGIVPFRLSRKLDKWKEPTKYQPTRAIVSVQYLRDEEVRCIEVSAASHTYLTNYCVVTHNTGKTLHAAGLLAMLHQTGELESVGRAIIIPRAPALGQWQNELQRMIPGLNLAMAQGTPSQRREIYASDWSTLLISPQTFNNDHDIFRTHFDLSLLLTDDVDALRNRDTDTAKNIKAVARQSDRFVVMTGTPLQKHLREMWSTLEEVGGRQAFGTLDAFEARHVTTATVREFDERTGLQTKIRTVPAYRNMTEVKEKMAPMVLRRKVEDLKDVNLPTINVNDVFLDLYPAQRNKYDELRRGVLQIMKEQGTEVKHITALTQIHYGAQICGGLATLGESDGPNTSVKMDWIVEALQGDLEGEKVVLFANYKNSVRALQERFRRAGIGFETVWGEQPDRDARTRSQNRFWDDKNCQVLIGTQAIEQSLNLQVARHLINMDMIMNPSRMAQLAGRIRRDGSAYKHVFVHNLLSVNTQEERYLPLLEREQALADFVWDESNELFSSLPPLTLLQLIAG